MITIPDSIKKSDEYRSLDPERCEAFARRLANIKEICESLSSENRRRNERSFDEFIENLELDVAIRQEYEIDRLKCLSRWLVHYSWTFEVDLAKLRHYLSERQGVLKKKEVNFHFTNEECESWLQDIGSEIVRLLEDFSSAKNFTLGIGSLFLVDIAFSQLLTGCYIIRLGGLMRN